MAFTKYHLVVLSAGTIVLLVGVRLYFDRETYMNLYKSELERSGTVRTIHPEPETDTSVDALETMAAMIQQRNNISRILNLKQQKIGQLECEATAKGNGEKVSSTGGWCAQTSVEDSGQHKTDTKLVPVLAEFFEGKYVGSFGDGPGRYKQLLLETKKLKGYDAYDGAPFSEKTSDGRVSFLDLTLPQYGLPLYDWVMSLEVAEHIPQDYEAIFIDNIVRHAREGVVLSWAVPGQAGYSHINNRPFEYVKDLFHRLGFEHDPESSNMLKKAAKLEWLQANINVYRRKDLSRIDSIKTFLT
ncbi:uncharacterized protein LOC127847594 [Dreissena polymorpha]|uniref:Uncharacterized protein n=1 Tax=Dreissena polymorpha TaxID=45954 RepID=A0A9D4DKM4_DREPO|nr:uncharacterized protein LOC127847594 [Dreissena polymorpha]KAH3750733.1 hypothetical protein DPMN_185264 [Dreissena polymorpha]